MMLKNGLIEFWRGCGKLNSGRKITEGGVLLALYSVLLLMTIYLPIIGGILFFFLPIPFILMAIKHSTDRKSVV